ncbi:DUF4276 family protein [Curtobacterium sp. 458]|uniref:DUF4276 family protein n=1 Tax=Curtobacterium sp. 458 TaxID=3050069 RepID=UPI0025B3B4D9|nr:DUF4276 family protein [Curtobacterium sp. 458]WJX99712.1 DUF4276 family protein [Curtobacterium sp. 458]
MAMVDQIALVVEGQTEEAFVNLVMRPLAARSGVFLTPIVVHTSRAADGQARRGGGLWKHYERHLRNLLAQPHWTRVTTMIDYYAFPSDGPACKCGGPHRQPTCVEEIEKGMVDLVGSDPRFAPFVMLHEFETLVIAAGSLSGDVFGDSSIVREFQSMVDFYDGNAEMINDGPSTAPSKRVLQVLPDYDKVRDGVALIEPNLEAALGLTPRFLAWFEELGVTLPRTSGS